MRTTLALLACCLAAAAQETRREVAATPTPADAKPNSAQVPDVYAIPSQFERVLLLRFKYDTDLLAGLEKMVQQNKIQNAVILSCVGSVRNYHVHQVGNRTPPPKNVFVKDPSTPADIAALTGYVLNGRVHAHITLATPDKAFAGHLEPGNNVFTFALVTVGILPDKLDLSRTDDVTLR